MGALDQIVNGARDFACGIYSVQPGALIPNPIEQGLRMFWDEICDQPPPSPPLPPPPSTPFAGGQCCDTFYEVYGYVRYQGNPNNNVEQLLTRNQVGRVLGIDKSLTSGGGSNLYSIKRQRCDGSIYLQEVLSVGVNTPEQDVLISRVVPQYGGNNNCGNLDATYPPSPPPPEGGYTSPPINITLEDGDDSITVNFNFKPPTLPSVPATKLPSLIVNVQSPTLNIPVTFNFDGSVDFGDNTPPVLTLPSDIITKINNINNSVTNIEDDVIGNTYTLNNFYSQYDFNTSPPPFFEHPSVNRRGVGESEDGNEDEDDLLGVLVTLTTLPQKVQYGNPNCYFAGWVTFKTQEGYQPREQINFTQSYFTAPPGSNGVAYTFTNGAIGSLVLYSKKQSD